MGLSRRDVSEGISVPYQRVNKHLNRRRNATPSTALRLSKFLAISADFWLNIQQRWDLYHAERAEAKAFRKIKRVHRSNAA